VLTLFAFSSDNGRRPRGEVARIFALLRRFLRAAATRRATRRATRLATAGDATRAGFARCVAPGLAVADVDLFLRPDGERRLSDFLRWESAYAERVVLDRLWPDVAGGDLATALAEFRARDRRFGRVAAGAG